MQAVVILNLLFNLKGKEKKRLYSLLYFNHARLCPTFRSFRYSASPHIVFIQVMTKTKPCPVSCAVSPSSENVSLTPDEASLDSNESVSSQSSTASNSETPPEKSKNPHGNTVATQQNSG